MTHEDLDILIGFMNDINDSYYTIKNHVYSTQKDYEEEVIAQMLALDNMLNDQVGQAIYELQEQVMLKEMEYPHESDS